MNRSIKNVSGSNSSIARFLRSLFPVYRWNIAAAFSRRKYYPDFVCYQKIIVELKAVTTLSDEHRAQVLNYLKASKFELGLLVNFGHYPKLEYERIAKTNRLPQSDESFSF